MLNLSSILADWGTSAFNDRFKNEISAIAHDSLPLQNGLTQSSYVSNEKVSVMVLNTSEDASFINIKAGIFYTGIIAGCSCADDPTPLDTQNEYCEVSVSIHRQSGDTAIKLISD